MLLFAGCVVAIELGFMVAIAIFMSAMLLEFEPLPVFMEVFMSWDDEAEVDDSFFDLSLFHGIESQPTSNASETVMAREVCFTVGLLKSVGRSFHAMRRTSMQ